MDQLRIFIIVLDFASGFLRFFGFKISACRSEERNNRVKVKGKQGYYLQGR